MYAERVLSGMRPTGALHLGHYHGVLKNWVRLQHDYPCLFFVADWHALTTQYDDPRGIAQASHDMLIDWLAAGVDPERATLFIQSQVPEHAELHLLMSMMTPLGWLERVPTYKDQQEKLAGKDLTTYGFLGYPLLMSADILIYRADKVPVGEDQIPHVEFTRELARRFNHMYGREPGFEEKVEAVLNRLNSKNRRSYKEARTRFQQNGDKEALARGKALLAELADLSGEERERLAGSLEGTGKMILVEPGYLLTEESKMPGLDGQKMSKSYDTAITLRESGESVAKKVRAMPTDTQRARRNDPGDPARCPVWQLHQVYTDEATRQWASHGCQTAGIGCLDCKQPVIDGILREQVPMRERAQMYLDQPALLREIVAAGRDKARTLAQETMRDVRVAMGLA
jgi:tryptophanyl-tRNA synthetase